MYDVLGLVLPLFGLILLGFAIARITRRPLEELGWLNTFIIYVALPGLFIQLLSKTPIEQLTEWGYVFGSVLATYIVFALMFFWSYWRSGGDIGESTIKALAASYGNIGYMGPGLALIIFGEQAAVPVAIIVCFENIAHFTMTPLLMGLSRKDGSSALDIAAGVARKIAYNPLIIGVLIGFVLAWAQLPIPLPIERILEYLARAAAPCALFAMGVSLALRPLTRVSSDMGLIVALKLIVHPIICYVLLSWIGNFSQTWLFTAVLLAALPAATNVFVLAQQYGVWVQRATASVLLSTLASVVTLTVLIYVITKGLLPPDLFP